VPKIVFDQIEKSFGNTRVLSPFDLQLEDGEFTVLVGPSGCGKSTTLRILAGLETPSGGEIYFDEKPISHLEPKERDMAMVFRALVRDAGTFLFDEPLSNLDAKLRAKLRAELAQMRKKIDKNMVYVTHDQVEAMTLGDRIVVMSGGKIQQQGTPEELFKRPVNRFVAGFIGSPTMNFLDGDITQNANDLIVAGEGFRITLPNDLKARLEAHQDRSVLVGIRPSSFAMRPSNDSSIALEVLVSEYLGTNTVLVTRCGAQELLIETGSDKPIPVGSHIQLSVKTEEIMLFDKSTEVAF